MISRHCDGLARQIEQAQQRLHDLRQEAPSISALWAPLSGAMQALPVSDHAHALQRSGVRPPVNEQLKALAREWFVSSSRMRTRRAANEPQAARPGRVSRTRATSCAGRSTARMLPKSRPQIVGAAAAAEAWQHDWPRANPQPKSAADAHRMLGPTYGSDGCKARPGAASRR